MKEKVRFGLVADSHYARRPAKGTRNYQSSKQKMQFFIDQMNKEKVDFIVHLGDFKDEDPIPDQAKTLSYLTELEAIFTRFNGPTYHCIGNHDIDSITKQQFLKIVTNTDIAQQRTYYSFHLKGIHFIVLDSNFTKDGKDHFFAESGHWEETYISPKQLDWLDKELREHNQKTIIFCHHPLFEYHRTGYRFSLMNYKDVQTILEKHPHVTTVFQGHVHQASSRIINGIEYVTISGMVEEKLTKEEAYQIIEID